MSAINLKNKPLPSVPDGMPVVSTTVEVVDSILPRVGLVACCRSICCGEQSGLSGRSGSAQICKYALILASEQSGSPAVRALFRG